MGYKKQQHKQKAQQKHRGGKEAGEEPAAAVDGVHQKGGAKQRRRGKKEVGVYSGDSLEGELRAVGLRIKAIEADGNCFFRSVCDQLEGGDSDHLDLRRRVMEFIEGRADEYRLFMEDDEVFETYTKRMKKEGAWAGNLELVATSLLLQRNIAVYQAGQPVWHIRHFPEAPEDDTLHLSYHDGMHYNSVRSADDFGSGPPLPPHVGSAAATADPTAAAAVGASGAFGAAEVDQVVAGTGCCDRQRISGVLEQCGGSVDQAIELLIEQLGAEEEAEVEPAAEAAAEQGTSGAAAAEGQQRAAVAVEQTSSVAAEAGEEAQQAARAAATEQEQQQQHVQHQGQRPSDGSIRLALLPRPADPGSISRAPQPAQQPAQQLDEEHQEQGPEAEVEEATDGAADADSPAGGKQAGGGKKGVKLKYKALHPGRNQRCPCGSKKKVKNCHCGYGRAPPAPATTATDGSSAAAAAQLQVLYI